MCLGVPGRVTEIWDGGGDLDRKGRVSFGGVIREVSLAFVPEAEVGSFVLIHVGVALSVLDEAEAERTLEILDGLESGVLQGGLR